MLIASVTYLQKQLLNWYDINGRRFPWRTKSASNYKKFITEILLQRTQAGTVARIYPIFFKVFRNWKDLAEASVDEIGEVLRPLGLWRQRANKLQALAQLIISRKGRIPKLRTEIDQLPGAGQYVANAVELLFHSARTPLLDVNMARVLERFFGPRKLADIRYDPYLQALAYDLVNCERPIDINFAILDFAALVCKARNPSRLICPVSKKCQYFRNIKK